MPYISERQRRYFNANRKKLEEQGVDVNEWNETSRGKKLPEKAKQAGIYSEFAGSLLNPVNSVLGVPLSLGTGAYALMRPTRTIDQQAAADNDKWKNLLIPGKAYHNAWKRIGWSARGKEIQQARQRNALQSQANPQAMKKTSKVGSQLHLLKKSKGIGERFHLKSASLLKAGKLQEYMALQSAMEKLTTAVLK